MMLPLSVEDIQSKSFVLFCTRCGRKVTAHTRFAPDKRHIFVRPLLPIGYRYLDELNEGDHILYRNMPWYGSEKVLDISVSGNNGRDLAPLICLKTEALVVNPPGVHYDSANTIVELLDPALPIGQGHHSIPAQDLEYRS